MSERRQILILVVVTAVIGLLGVTIIQALPSLSGKNDINVDSYEATFYPDGTLVEEYTYTISSRSYRFLYRNWEAPLSFSPLSVPYIEKVEIRAAYGAIGYAKDDQGRVVFEGFPPPEAVNLVKDLAYRNEVGSINHNYYNPGEYKVGYTFKVHPPLEHDDEYAHLNLKLANEHMAYSEVTIILEDAGYISRVYPHPPSMKVTDEGNRIIITGRSGEDALLEIEMLLDLEALDNMDGFPEEVANVASKTASANLWTSVGYNASRFTLYGVQGLMLLMPVLLYLIYDRY
ncbi:MAG TPA: DUF2207 domain-containing protein, partial [Patescibacteria group bacterium]|nr:DUF2207 domain-containing protein [Patescibacteria group bacterium]